MNLGEAFLRNVVLMFLIYEGKCEDTYDIPVTFNPLIQGAVEIESTVKLFYDKDKPFYSRVTVIDAASSAQQRVRDTIQKTINVVFLTVASSHVSKTLKLSDLKYTTKSNWSYSVDVDSILEASQGTLESINHDTIIYKIQENAMKVLEKRFEFESSEIRTQLSLEPIDYYAVDETKWINVVGIIVKKVIEKRSEDLHLTSCYLAEMIGETVARMEGFTLHEVDMYIYNTTMLMEKLPEYRDDVVERLYQTFKITPAELASISSTDVSAINNMILHDVLQLFTNSVLEKLRVKANEVIDRDPSFDTNMLLSCTDKWNPFLTIIIDESFHNSAEAMAVEIETLSALINISYAEITQYTITQMINLLESTIDPLTTEKKLVEATRLSRVLELHGSDKIDNKNDNIFEVIYRFTNFTERQLTTLYEWTSDDYLFSSMFTLQDVNNVCTIDAVNYDLLTLARLTTVVGQMGDIQCQSFSVLREIWNRENVNFLEDKYSPGKQLPLDIPISMMVSQLTKAPSTINYRVLNITSEAEKLISSLSINNITAVTTYQSSYLKKLSFQDIIGIIVHLNRNGSFDHQVVSHYILTSLTPSLISTPTHIHTTNNKFATSTGQKSHTTTAVLNTPRDSDEHVTVVTSSNLFLPSSSNLLELTSTAHIPHYTTIKKSDQLNRTIELKPTTFVTKTRRLQSSTTKQYHNSEFVSISHSKMPATINLNNITSSYRSATPKYTLDDYSRSSIFPSYNLLTKHASSATTKHLNSPSTSHDRNSQIKSVRNSTFITSTMQLHVTPSLRDSYFSNSNKLASINHTTSKQRFMEYTTTSTLHSSTTSSSKDLNVSKSTMSQRYYQHNISSTTTVRVKTWQTLTVSLSSVANNVTAVYKSKELKSSTVLANVTFPSATKTLSRSKMNTFSPRLNSSYKLSTNALQTKNHTLSTFVHQSNTKTSLNTQNTQSLSTDITLSTILTGSQVPSLTREQKITTTTNDITSIVTSYHTTSYTTSTKVMASTTKSSPAMAGIDASSKEHFSSRANNSLPNTISLVIQTTQSTMLTSIKTTSTAIVIPKEITSSARVEPSSTMNVFTTNTIFSTQGPPSEKPSTNTNQPTTTFSTVDKASSTINSHTTSVNVPHVQTSSPHLSTIPTPPISSQPTKVSTTSLATNMASTVKPNTTRLGASSSRIQKPGKVKTLPKNICPKMYGWFCFTSLFCLKTWSFVHLQPLYDLRLRHQSTLCSSFHSPS